MGFEGRVVIAMSGLKEFAFDSAEQNWAVKAMDAMPGLKVFRVT